jgi:ankyrin repeat protein
MDKDQQITDLTSKVFQLEEENRQLQSMLEKVIKKYKKLKAKKEDALNLSRPLEKKSSTIKTSKSIPAPPVEPKKSASSTDLAAFDQSIQILQNIEIDNLSFIQSIISSITVNFYFESKGTFIIHEAVKAGAIKILNYICTKGGDMNSKTSSGDSPLTLGAEENKHDAMCIILQQGRERIDLEHQNQHGMTAMQIAVKNGNKEIVSLLLVHGANANGTNLLGDSLVKLAQRNGHQEIVLLLVNAGASLR